MEWVRSIHNACGIYLSEFIDGAFKKPESALEIGYKPYRFQYSLTEFCCLLRERDRKTINNRHFKKERLEEYELRFRFLVLEVNCEYVVQYYEEKQAALKNKNLDKYIDYKKGLIYSNYPLFAEEFIREELGDREKIVIVPEVARRLRRKGIRL